MGVYGGPNVSEDGLVLALDAANQKCISPLGCTGFNNAPQLVKNIISQLDTINSYNGVKLGNLNYYTVFAIDYPEGSYGGDGASRDGITPGYNVRSGGKTFDFGRALNYAVYNNITQSWVKTTIYDTYEYSSEVDRFVSEYATAVTTYPDAVHLVAGSHRDINHSAAQYNILKDLGAPSNVDSIINFSSPEWILIGKPGLGAGNAYGWVFQNYSTNPDQVAHLNFGLPIYGTKDNYLEFDGSDDYVTISSGTNFTFGTGDFSMESWYNPAISYANGNGYIFDAGVNGTRLQLYANRLYFILSGGVANVSTTAGVGILSNTWYHAVGTRINSTINLYLNGSVIGSSNGNYNLSDSGGTIGNYGGGGGYNFNGRISNFRVYKGKGLTAAEVSQNFNALRGRFGL